MAECAAYCMREREFECKSAMYFWEEGECITNVESAITAPDDFQRPDDDDKVIFFHNGCILPGTKRRKGGKAEKRKSKFRNFLAKTLLLFTRCWHKRIARGI
jgi:hypothetical protein